MKEKVSRLEAEPDKTSSVHVEQSSSTRQKNPIIPIVEPGNIPDGRRLHPLRLVTLPVVDLDKDDDAFVHHREVLVFDSSCDANRV